MSDATSPVEIVHLDDTEETTPTQALTTAYQQLGLLPECTLEHLPSIDRIALIPPEQPTPSTRVIWEYLIGQNNEFTPASVDNTDAAVLHTDNIDRVITTLKATLEALTNPVELTYLVRQFLTEHLTNHNTLRVRRETLTPSNVTDHHSETPTGNTTLGLETCLITNPDPATGATPAPRPFTEYSQHDTWQSLLSACTGTLQYDPQTVVIPTENTDTLATNFDFPAFSLTPEHHFLDTTLSSTR